jgi:hypothetical protein
MADMHKMRSEAEGDLRRMGRYTSFAEQAIDNGGQMTTQAMQDLATERKRQDEKWGEQNHDPLRWLAILGEEYGEACKALLTLRFTEPEPCRYRDELVHVAAVAVAAIEAFDRRYGRYGNEVPE